jgi:hypothetical protein
MDRRDDPQIARAWGDGVAPRVALGAIAALYIAGVFLEGSKTGLAAKLLKFPPPLAYFSQVAGLFPHAARNAIDYRVEGYRCKDGAWFEIDHRPWFPIDAEHKENRFYRAMHFYADGGHPHRQTLRRLDDFIVTHYNAAAPVGGRPGRDGATDMIGGVRFTKVTTPIGNPGEPAERYRRRPIAEYPEDQRKVLFYTPESKREERCRWIAR